MICCLMCLIWYAFNVFTFVLCYMNESVDVVCFCMIQKLTTSLLDGMVGDDIPIYAKFEMDFDEIVSLKDSNRRGFDQEIL